MQVVTQANPVYKGYIRWNRFHNETKTIKKAEEWIIRKGNHPPILSEELFDKAQKRYQMEYHPRQERASASYQHWLSGMVKCSACGRSLSYNRVEKKGKNYSYFQCYGYSKKICSVSHGISEQKLIAALFASLREAACTGITYKQKKQEQKKAIQEELQYLVQVQLENLERKEERIQTAYIDGADTLEEYKQKKQLLREEKERLEQQKILSFSKEEEADKIGEAEQIWDVITALESDCFTNVEKNKAVHTIIEKIVYEKEQKRISIYYCLKGNKQGKNLP